MVRACLLTVLLLLMATPAFSAGVLSYSPNPALYYALPGDAVVVLATLQNTGDAPLYLNDRSVVLNGAAASYFGANPFFNFFNSIPGIFENTDAPFNGTIEEILIDPATPFGSYTVTIELIGGDTPLLTNPASDGIGTRTFTIVVGPPVAPSNLSATTLVAGSITATWNDNSSSETRFELAQDDSLSVVRTVGADVTTAAFTGLDSSTTFHFYVRACNVIGCSSWVGPVLKIANGVDDPSTPVINLLTGTPPGLSQSIAPFHGGAFVLTVNGANFDAGAAVSLGGLSLVTNRISPTQLTAQVPSTALTTTGTKAVVVTNGGGNVSTVVSFKVVVRGDTNSSGSVNIGDALACAQTVGGVIKPPLPNTVGDLNLSGSTDIGDCLITALFAGRINPNFSTPAITSVSPSPAVPGNSLTINGVGFSPPFANNQVLFTTLNSAVVRVTPVSGNSTSMVVTVPVDAVTGPIQVYRSDAPLGGAEFPAVVSGSTSTLVLTAVQSFFQLSAGSSVTLTGQGFGPLIADNVVLFKSASGTVGATVTAASTTSLTVTVPSGAICGPVTVGAGAQTSNARTVTVLGTSCSVQLNDLWGGGSPGDVVVLEGAGFDVVTPANNIVKFTSATGTVTAPILAAGGTQLHVRIPGTAIHGGVTVTVGSSTSNPLQW